MSAMNGQNDVKK